MDDASCRGDWELGLVRGHNRCARSGVMRVCGCPRMPQDEETYTGRAGVGEKEGVQISKKKELQPKAKEGELKDLVAKKIRMEEE